MPTEPVAASLPPTQEGESSQTHDPNARGDRGDCRGRGGRGRGSGRNDGRESRGGRGHPKFDRIPLFKGDTAEMNGHVFKCRSETTNPKQLVVTLDKIYHYVSKIFKSTSDLDPIFSRFITPEVIKPVKPEDDKDAMKVAIFNEDVKEFVKKWNALKDNIKNHYLVALGKTSKTMREKLLGLKNFKDFEEDQDVATLLKEFKAISYEYK